MNIAGVPGGRLMLVASSAAGQYASRYPLKSMFRLSVSGYGSGFASSQPTTLKTLYGQIRQIPDGNVLDLSVFPKRASKEVGDVSLSVVILDRGYVDIALVLAHAPRSTDVGGIAQPLMGVIRG
jgi:hypothetical protein